MDDRRKNASIPTMNSRAFKWILLLALGVGCVPTVEESRRELLTLVEGRSGGSDEAIMERLTGDSRQWMRQTLDGGPAGGLMNAMRITLRHGRPHRSIPGLILGGEPGLSVLFTRDGHSRPVDLALSGVTFAGLREFRYPVPW